MIERYENKSVKVYTVLSFSNEQNVESQIVSRTRKCTGTHIISISFFFYLFSFLIFFLTRGKSNTNDYRLYCNNFFPRFLCMQYIYINMGRTTICLTEIETLWTIVRVIVISCKFDRENSFLRFETQLSRGSMAGSLFFFNYHGYRIIYSELHILFQPSNDT